jgi:hypothetical protein
MKTKTKLNLNNSKDKIKMNSIKDLIQETEVDKIEKELLAGIKETGITQIERGLLDDMRISYLVMTAQLLGLRQGRDETLKQCQTIAEENIEKIKSEWEDKARRMNFMTGEVAIFELNQIINQARDKK